MTDESRRSALHARREATRRITLGAVKIVVIAPVLFAIALPLVALLSSFAPLYFSGVAAAFVVIDGGVDVARGVAARRTSRLGTGSIPAARVIDRR